MAFHAAIFPDLFEEVPDPVERVMQFCYDSLPGSTKWTEVASKHKLMDIWLPLAQALIAAGLDVEKLEGIK